MKSRNSLPIDHVLWAVDISAPEPRLQHAVAGALRALTHGKRVAIEPVHVLSSSQAGVPQEIFEKNVKYFERPTEQKLRKWISKVKLTGLVKPSLVIWKSVYLRSDIDALMKHAKNKGADLIAITTHARQGLSRFLLGSFAETLLLHSRIPLFVVNPRSKVPKQFKRILFPTDLSAGSRKIFEKMVSVATFLDAEIILYHWMMPYHEQTGLALAPTTFYKITERERRRSRREKLDEWVSWAEKQGAKVQVRINCRKTSAPDAILSEARKLDAVFIAIAAQSGPLATVIVGSTVRKVVRHADCPVWVLHA
jgi:nucleotide-binding universal stress UspA family protein